MIEIEKNIPFPVRDPAPKVTRYVRYPFGRMEVGDSFFMPYDGVEPFRLQSLVLTAAKRNTASIKVTTSKLPHGLRVWRVS